ncbi:arylformamidase [Lecanora helva]
MAFVQKGDEVILLEPVFQMYEYQIYLAGGTPRFVPVHAPPNSKSTTVSGNKWTVDLKELEAAINPNTRMLVLNNPHNPIGKCYTREELLAIGRLCVKHDIILMADEVYEHLNFDKTHIPVAPLDPEIASHTLTAHSLGKLFNATGWRIGFVIGPQHLMSCVVNAHLITAYASSSPAQEAAAQGLRQAETNGFWASNNRDVEHRIGRICNTLRELEIPFVNPRGAYFLFVDISRLNIPKNYPYPEYVATRGKDFKTCYWMIQEIGVSSIPGSCFYAPDHAHLGENYIRFGACKSDEGLDLATERLRKLKPILAPKQTRGARL